VLLVVVLPVITASGQVPPQPQQPRSVRRVAPKLHSAVGSKAEGLVDAEARGGGLGRRAATQPAAAVQAQQLRHAEREVVEECVAVEEGHELVAAVERLGHSGKLAVARVPLAQQLVPAGRCLHPQVE